MRYNLDWIRDIPLHELYPVNDRELPKGPITIFFNLLPDLKFPIFLPACDLNDLKRIYVCCHPAKSIREMAKILGVSKMTICRWRKQCEVKAKKAQSESRKSARAD